MGPERVRDRVRGAAGARRADLRPRRAQARLPRRARALPRRLGRSAPPRPRSSVLVGARVVQAAGAAFMVPTSLGLLLPEFPPAQRATAVGAWAAVGGVAAAAGPPIGGLLVEASWRWVFLVNIPVGLVALWSRRAHAARAPRPEPGAAPRRARRRDARRRRSRSLVLGIVKGPDWGWDSTGVLGGVRRRRGAAARVPRPLRAPPGAGRRAADAARALVRGRERRRAALLRRVLARCCSAACSS